MGFDPQQQKHAHTPLPAPTGLLGLGQARGNYMQKAPHPLFPRRGRSEEKRGSTPVGNALVSTAGASALCMSPAPAGACSLGCASLRGPPWLPAAPSHCLVPCLVVSFAARCWHQRASLLPPWSTGGGLASPLAAAQPRRPLPSCALFSTFWAEVRH